MMWLPIQELLCLQEQDPAVVLFSLAERKKNNKKKKSTAVKTRRLALNQHRGKTNATAFHRPDRRLQPRCAGARRDPAGARLGGGCAGVLGARRVAADRAVDRRCLRATRSL